MSGIDKETYASTFFELAKQSGLYGDTRKSKRKKSSSKCSMVEAIKTVVEEPDKEDTEDTSKVEEEYSTTFLDLAKQCGLY